LVRSVQVVESALLKVVKFAFNKIEVEIACIQVVDVFALRNVFIKVTLDEVEVEVKVALDKVANIEVTLRQLVEITGFRFRSGICD
jgi:hypothetical protein